MLYCCLIHFRPCYRLGGIRHFLNRALIHENRTIPPMTAAHKNAAALACNYRLIRRFTVRLNEEEWNIHPAAQLGAELKKWFKFSCV